MKNTKFSRKMNKIQLTKAFMVVKPRGDEKTTFNALIVCQKE